jgi:alpha-L-fucosidase
VDPEVVRFPGDSGIAEANDAQARGLRVTAQLQHGDEHGTVWRPGESDVSIRPGWFYHAAEDHAVRSVANLIDLYFKSVGRNSFLMLNAPPAPNGLVHPTDVSRLESFGRWRRETFSRDLAEGATLSRENPNRIELRLKSPQTFDIVSLAEEIELGQRVIRYRFFYQDTNGVWQWLIEGHTIGCRKLDRFDSVTAQAVRLEIMASRAEPVIREIALHRSAAIA